MDFQRDPDDEAALVTGLKAGDPRAFETLVRANTGRLLSVTRRILRHEEDARDAVQDAFIAAHRAIGSFAGDAKLSTWLHRIAVNAALMKLRSRKAHPEESLDGLLPVFDETGHHAEPPHAWTETGEAGLTRDETARIVRAAVDRLPDGYRTILILRDLEELDTGQAADALGITPNAAKIRLHRARQALRTLLDREFRGRRP